jgi:hypothetical protein
MTAVGNAKGQACLFNMPACCCMPAFPLVWNRSAHVANITTRLGCWHHCWMVSIHVQICCWGYFGKVALVLAGSGAPDHCCAAQSSCRKQRVIKGRLFMQLPRSIWLSVNLKPSPPKYLLSCTQEHCLLTLQPCLTPLHCKLHALP